MSASNLSALHRISQQNLSALGQRRSSGGAGGSELEALQTDPAAELARLVGRADRITGPMAVAVGLALVTQFLNGYNTAVLNAVSLVVFPGHSTAAWAAAVGAFAVGGPFGALAAGQLANRLGRRSSMLLSTYTFLAGGLLLTAAPSMLVLTAARVVRACVL